MKLIIVESPTKAKTISSFLKGDFKVLSSYGHVRDLPKSKIGIDVKNDFKPTYVIPVKAKENVEVLRTTAAKANEIILASDEDREGEAIAWHLAQVLSLENSKKTKKSKPKENNESNSNRFTINRIAFHEITKPAIEEALKNPREIDMNLVDAQQARRILDRLVGYELSPFLWHKIRYGLSAGRVQSVALRLVVEKEREIQKFNKEEYWSIEGTFLKPKDKKTFSAHLFAVDGRSLGKMDIKDNDSAQKIVNDLKDAKFSVSNISKKEVSRNPASPFTTSTLQQEASRKLGFSAKQTMVVAQQLYENGHITYMRTDSLNLASSALAQAKDVIGQLFGSDYQLASPRYYTNKSKNAQEAHEAIRPTNISKTPQSIELEDRSQIRLYSLIWKRTIACQMQSSKVEQTSVDINTENNTYTFRAVGQVVLFDGFMKVYTEGKDENGEEEGENNLPILSIKDPINAKEINPLQHFTEPPARYTDASLVKTLESYGIGRPSTYAPTLSTIQERGYVEKIEKKYHPTEIGFMVNDMLVEHFPEIVDLNFTAHIEEELDEIANGKIEWTKVCGEFYTPFKQHLESKEAEVEKNIQVSETPCPHCGKPMLIKFGRMGKFLACPEGAKVTLPMPEEAAKIKELEEKTKDEHCPICKKPMKVKRGRFGYFLGCVDYPTCKGISRIWNKTGFKCPLCLDTDERKNNPGDVVEKKGRGRGKPFWACTRWPDCNLILNKKPETQEELNELYQQWKNKPKETGDKKSKKRSKKQTA